MLLAIENMSGKKSLVKEEISQMSLSSMTGFGKAAGDLDLGSWTWEVKSVNGRGLDLRLNVPSGLEFLESEVKRRVQTRFRRGNLQLTLRIKYAQSSSVLKVNNEALSQLVEAYEIASGAKPDAEALAVLMTIKGIVESDSGEPSMTLDSPETRSVLLNGADLALESLAADRRREGEVLGAALDQQCAEMKSLAKKARGDARRQTDAVRERYRSRLLEFDSEGVVGEDRIATEVAILATKADVSEELDRLDAHLAQLSDLLKSSEEVGRKFGFLSQELIREANTLCSKSALLSLTETGLGLKGVIDQFKEQVANVE